MEDSFFGFDTSVPHDDDGGGRIEEPSEEEYDALNDETFGSAINGDWEEAHEKLVRFGTNVKCIENRDRDVGNRGASGDNSSGFMNSLPSAATSCAPALLSPHVRRSKFIADSDLELNLSTMKLDDVDITYDNDSFDGGGNAVERINMDPSVWGAHSLKNVNHSIETNEQQLFREQFRNPFQQQLKLEQHNYGLPPIPQATKNSPKITTLEDVERNMINQQALHTQQHMIYPKQVSNQYPQSPQKCTTPTPTQVQHQFQKKPDSSQQKVPPGFMANDHSSPPRSSQNFSNNLSQHPLGNLLQQQHHVNGATTSGNRLPPGFPLFNPGLNPNIQPQLLPPHPLLNQHVAIPHNFPVSHQRQLPISHLPVALNNFAMHPSFNAMRAAAVSGMHPAAMIPPLQQAPRIPPHLHHTSNPTVLLNQQQQPNSIYNMFNMRLVQEIQQNHPMLQNSAIGARQVQQHVRANSVGANVKQQHIRRSDGCSANGNLPQDEFDDYANLMSTRDKHWLIGIQLSQLNTDTPYIDDYYYTVYKERKALDSGNLQQSQAHKDNQLNHPLTQPKGHAQLILVQLGNKNGNRNGQHRERRNSENNSGVGTSNSGLDQKLPYIFTPLKFENSLGKLQYGSVTAPRKIIDAEVMSNDNTSEPSSVKINSDASEPLANQAHSNSVQGSTLHSASVCVGDITPSTQRKSRHILLHIETLYRWVLKLEDLENPTALATIIMKKKKENERIAALELIENANRTEEERSANASNPQPLNPALRNKFTYEIESKEALVSKLMAGLSHEKVVAMMNVRKGKVLIRRIMSVINENYLCWNVWIAVFCSLQNVIKKDRDDIDGLLYALYPEFKKQMTDANFSTIVKISTSIILNDKKLTGIFCSKFGISTLVCLILQSEKIVAANTDTTLTEKNKEKWRQFLGQVAALLNRTIQNQTISAAIESDSIQPMMNHFARFKDLKLDSLLALITQAKQQIN